MKGYSTKDVARMLDLSVGQVRSFARAGFLEPDRGPRGEYRFSFQDLVLLRTAKGLSASRVPARRLRQTLRKLRRELPNGHHLSGVQIEAEGDEVVVRQGDAIWNPESGQGRFNFEVSELARKVRPHARLALRQAKTASKTLDAEEWYELGFDLEAAAPEQSQEAYRQALNLQPDHVDARVNLGRLLHIAGNLHAAEAQFRLALSTAPRNATVHFNLGVTLEDLGRRDDAMHAYQEAIKSDPECADAYFNLARLFEQTGDAKSALRYLKTYRDLTENI